MKTMQAALTKTFDMPFDEVVQKAESALAEEGFGILTRIDVKATLKEKIGADFYDYVILGACNPPIAHRALSHAPEVGVFMPCNVVVREEPGGKVRLDVMNAGMMADMFPDKTELPGIAGEVMERLERVLAAL